MLVLLGLVRAVALLHKGTGASWRDAVGAFFIWQSTSGVVGRASLAGLFARQATFLRTPKTSERTTWREAIGANSVETGLAALGVLGIVAGLLRPTGYAGPLLAGLLIFPTLGLAAAPYNSFAAARATLPDDLRRRRATEWLRDREALVRTTAAGVGVLAVTAAAAAAVLLFAPTAPTTAPAPQLLEPARGRPAVAPSPPGSPRSAPPVSGTSTPPAGSNTSSVSPTPSGPSPGSATATGTATPSPTGSSATATIPTTTPAGSGSGPATPSP